MTARSLSLWGDATRWTFIRIGSELLLSPRPTNQLRAPLALPFVQARTCWSPLACVAWLNCKCHAPLSVTSRAPRTLQTIAALPAEPSGSLSARARCRRAILSARPAFSPRSRIRPHGQPASLSAGFEELASILIEQGLVEWPQGVRFARFGNPDGGREGKGVLPNGDVWAWQAKYLVEFDSSTAGRVTSSVHAVLSHEQNLRRYIVALPFNLPAGDTEDRTSASTRWTEKVSEWEALARGEGLEVEFLFMNEHQLLTALTEPKHAGRARYWFGADVLTPEFGRSTHRPVAAAASGRRGRR